MTAGPVELPVAVVMAGAVSVLPQEVVNHSGRSESRTLAATASRRSQVACGMRGAGVEHHAQLGEEAARQFEVGSSVGSIMS
jgi:hypothetical protein